MRKKKDTQSSRQRRRLARYRAEYKRVNAIRDRLLQEHRERVLAANENLPRPTLPAWPKHPMIAPEPKRVRVKLLFNGGTCGGLTAQPAPCRSSKLFPNGRCRWHGGE